MPKLQTKKTTVVDAPAPSYSEEEPTKPIDEKVALAPALWFDPDVHWLTGVHEAEGHLYLVRESYEELLWWLLMPSLLRLAGEPAPSRADVEELSRTVEEALATAEAANYRVDELLGWPRQRAMNRNRSRLNMIHRQSLKRELRSPSSRSRKNRRRHPNYERMIQHSLPGSHIVSLPD